MPFSNRALPTRVLPSTSKRAWWKRLISDNVGFTLVETVLSVLVLSITLMGLWKAFDATVASSMQSEKRTLASFLARQKMEIVMADKKVRQNGYAYVVNANYPAEASLAAPFASFSRSTNIVEVRSNDLATPQAGTGYKSVSVTVTWQEGGQNRQLQLTTLMTQWGT